MTPEDRIKAQEDRQADERARLAKEITIAQYLPESLTALDSIVHMHKLYDRIGSIHFKYHRYESIRKGQPDLTTAHIREMLATFPPVDVAVYRDGCVGVRTLANALEMFEKNDNATYGPIAPFWFVYNPSSYSQEFSIHYIGQTPIGLLEVETFFPMHCKLARTLGYVHVQWSNSNPRYEDSAYVVSNIWKENADVRIVKDARQSVINYGSGDPRKTPGTKLVYYDSANGQPANLSLAEMLDIMDAIAEKA